MITVAGSAGGFEGVRELLEALPRGLACAIAVALHTSSGSALARTLALRSRLGVREACSGDLLHDGWVYVAPPCRHLIVNPDGRLTISDADPVRRFCPSADWLFESAAASFLERHLAVVLSGALSDGARQLRTVKRSGGVVLAQARADSLFSDMPAAAIATGFVDQELSIAAIADTICAFVRTCSAAPAPSWN